MGGNKNLRVGIILDLLEENSISKNELAEAIGLTPQGVRDIFRNGSTKLSTLKQIAKTLDVDVASLIGG